MDTTPHTLIQRLRHQDTLAWERFVELFTVLLDRWAHRLGLDDNDSADLVQDVFVILLKRMPTFDYDPSRSFRGWLWTVTVNCWKARTHRKEVTLDAANSLSTPDFTSQIAEKEDHAHVIQAAMRIMRSDFDPKIWRAFWAVTMEETSPREVATNLGISINSVYLAKSRVLTRLRQELDSLWP